MNADRRGWMPAALEDGNGRTMPRSVAFAPAVAHVPNVPCPHSCEHILPAANHASPGVGRGSHECARHALQPECNPPFFRRWSFSVLSQKFIEKVCSVGRSPWTAADALVGLLGETKTLWNARQGFGPNTAGPGGPARTRGSDPQASAPQIFFSVFLGQETSPNMQNIADRRGWETKKSASICVYPRRG